MAENTLQYEWITTLKGGIEALLGDRAFVAGDLFWYPVEGEPGVVMAPDVLVAFGRPLGHRGSYRQWEEGGVAPHVVFEVLSPSNTLTELERKRAFYDRHGVEEYVVVDPAREDAMAFVRDPSGQLELVPDIWSWVSPRLGVGLRRAGRGTLRAVGPDGSPLLSYAEQADRGAREAARADREAARAEQEAARAEQEAARAEQEAARAEQEAARADRMAARLRALGIDLDG